MNFFRRLIDRGRLYDDLSAEIQQHIDEKTEFLIARGITREEARRSAYRQFGNRVVVEERSREIWQFPTMESLWSDAKYALRQLRKSPGYACTAILTLAIGIGANTATFSSFTNTLSPRLPYQSPARLMLLWGNNESKQWDEMDVSAPEVQDWQAQSQAFEQIAAFSWTQSENLSANQTVLRVRVSQVTPNLFSTLGIQQQLGRTFLPEEAAEGHNNVAMVSYGFWRRILGGRPDIVGRTIALDEKPYTVVGVLPEQFSLPLMRGVEDILTPLSLNSSEAQNRSIRYLVGIGRLRDGASQVTARSEMQLIASRLASQYPQTNAGFTVNVESLFATGTADARQRLPFFALVTGLLLLLVCANITSLLLARFAGRQRDISLRFALGASRARILQQSLLDSLFLAVSGGALGLLLAHFGSQLLQHFEPFYLPWKNYSAVDFRVFVFCAILTLGASLLTGTIPALLATRPRPLQHLGDQNQRVHGGSKPFRRLLVTTEIAISLTLLIGSGVMLKTLFQLLHSDQGFDVQHLSVGAIHLGGARFTDDAAKKAFVRDLLSRIGAHPEVQSAGVTSAFPLSNANALGGAFYAEGQPKPGSISEAPTAGVDPVSSRYLQTLGVRLVAGRLLRDYEPTPVTVINRTLAERYWPHQSAIGKHVYFLKPSQEVENNISPGAREIVGVVADVDMYGPRSQPWPFMYIPYDQNPVAPLSVAIRASSETEALRILTETLQQIDSNMPLFHTGTAEEYAAQALTGDYFDLYLLAIFASVAMLLSASGIFAVLAHSVIQRKAEFGIRMAIGASRRNILLLVLRESLKLAVAGLAIGTCVAAFLTRIMGALVVRSSLWDAAIYGAAVVLIAVAIFAASLIPALRAASIDPMVALRAE